MAYFVKKDAAFDIRENALLCAEVINDDSSCPPCIVPTH